MERDLQTRKARLRRALLPAALALAPSLGCEWLPGRQGMLGQGLIAAPAACAPDAIRPPISPSIASSLAPPATIDLAADYPPLPSGPPGDEAGFEEPRRDEEVKTTAYNPPEEFPDLAPPGPPPLPPSGRLTVRIEEAFSPPEFAKAPEAPQAQPSWEDRWDEALEQLDRLATQVMPGISEEARSTHRQMIQDLRNRGAVPDVKARRQLIASMERDFPLGILELVACRSIRGFGQYEALPDAPEVSSGDDILVYCEMVGMRSELKGEQHRSWLESAFEVLPGSAGDAPPLCHAILGQEEDLCRKLRRDYYVSYRVSLPEGLEPGDYRLKLIQKDLIAGRTVEREIPFRVTVRQSLAGGVEMPSRSK